MKPSRDILAFFGINGSLRRRDVQAQNSFTEYYLFNSAANLKAYSNNGLDFAYYGYNASNTRAYKLSMLNMNLWVNGQPEPLDLQLQSAMFYPNAYINFNQNGEYTKHYYNGAERIASRLGSSTQPTDATSNDRLEYRMMREEEKFRENIQELVSEGQPVDFQGTVELNSLQPVNVTSDIFYYNTNHLGSTAFVTDNNATITQGFLYAPFGEITTEFNATFGNDIIPKYSFNAKELDEETGMYYYEARYYKPPVFTSRDRLFEKYPWTSPYGYCMNNPIKFVDPSGDSVAILLAGNAVGGLGHMAILIQKKVGDDTKWFLYSKNGDDDGNYKRVSGEERGTKDDMGYGGPDNVGFESVQDFLNNTTENTEKHDGEGGIYYTQAYVLPTTSEQDNKIRDGMVTKLNEDYNFFFNNCSQAVTYALRNADVNLFSLPFGNPMSLLFLPPIDVGKGTVPVTTFEKIRMIHHGEQTLYPR